MMFISIFVQALQTIDTMAETVHEHPLTLLAEETKKLLKTETTLFVPILSQWHPQAIVASVYLLHKLYGIKLVRCDTLHRFSLHYLMSMEYCIVLGDIYL